MTLYGKEAIEANERRKARFKSRMTTIGAIVLLAILVGSLIHYT
jgi:hypothetical protein